MKGKTKSNKAVKKASAPMKQAVPKTSKRRPSVTIEEVEDDEPTYQGETLEGRGDIVMEEVESTPATNSSSPVEIVDSDDEEVELGN